MPYAPNLGDVLDLIGYHQATITADGLSAAIDLKEYEGEIALVLLTPGSTGNANNTIDVEVHEADASGGSYTAAAGGAFTQVGYNAASQQKISLNSDELKRFIKIDFDVAGTDPSYPVAVAVMGVKKNAA